MIGGFVNDGSVLSATMEFEDVTKSWLTGFSDNDNVMVMNWIRSGNQFVEANRNFTVIDTLDNFLNSGYAYTADYKDAYLDVTHEGLKISEQAIVLISEDKYNTLINDPAIAEQLKNRRD